ncbi:hypothetical protein B0H67DRAFT_144220 [Lasiosphaeris hirsuta]|uniref:Uncharacterized protein n=1 Tax=Lasiosphaeris hirsuta TaxID=260670 RepID=A0AA40B1M2_9PEZI|nr:hypothetical protein B0H67DRAFT_144220 [Lasiosphaeris hirsuta]
MKQLLRPISAAMRCRDACCYDARSHHSISDPAAAAPAYLRLPSHPSNWESLVQPPIVALITFLPGKACKGTRRMQIEPPIWLCYRGDEMLTQQSDVNDCLFVPCSAVNLGAVPAGLRPEGLRPLPGNKPAAHRSSPLSSSTARQPARAPAGSIPPLPFGGIPDCVHRSLDSTRSSCQCGRAGWESKDRPFGAPSGA